MAEEEESEESSGGDDSDGGSHEDRARGDSGDSEKEEKVKILPFEGPDPDAWMVTFSDLVSLMMTFFVMVFATADPIEEKILEAFGQSQGVFEVFRKTVLDKFIAVQRRDVSQDRLQIFLDEVGAIDIDLNQEDRGLVVTLPSDTYFEPGGDNLNDRARKRLTKLVKYLDGTKHNIRIEGHTDDRETKKSRFKSSWVLSVARGDSVLREFLRTNIDPKRLSLTGYGSVRPRYTNESRGGRARNRRVEIVILNR